MPRICAASRGFSKLGDCFGMTDSTSLATSRRVSRRALTRCVRKNPLTAIPPGSSDRSETSREAEVNISPAASVHHEKDLPLQRAAVQESQVREQFLRLLQMSSRPRAPVKNRAPQPEIAAAARIARTCCALRWRQATAQAAALQDKRLAAI